MVNTAVSNDLYKEIAKYGARDMEICMQCGNCSASCPLSKGSDTFPRKIYRYIQLGLKDKLLAAPEPWLCYYCGECNKDCPRGAEPAETMMAARRWLTTQFDWTGLANKFYSSPTWEMGAFIAVFIGIVLLFLFGHGPVVTDRVSLNSYAPAHWVHRGDQIMLVVLGALLLSNGFRMYRGIMMGTKISIFTYMTQAPIFLIHYLTQKRWRKCGTGPSSRWLRHFLLFSGYVTMEVLVIGFLEIFQTDVVHPFWHPTRIFGYYATVALLLISGNMLYSRWFVKEEILHRYSDFTDIFFLILLFISAFTGILTHLFRIAGWPIATYTIYTIHVAICVGMLSIMLPFGKLSHLFYRPFAIFLTTLKEKATKESRIDVGAVVKETGDVFMSCMQCGICSSVCPWNTIAYYSPRQILRHISLETCTEQTVDTAVWNCVTCGNCTQNCPREIDMIDLIKNVRDQNVNGGNLPSYLRSPVQSLEKEANPWNGKKEDRLKWIGDTHLPEVCPDHEYCLFTCCTTAYDISPSKKCQHAGQALVKLLEDAEVSFGIPGINECCCGDHADTIGAKDLFLNLAQQNTDLFIEAGIKKILTSSPHCMESFRKKYDRLRDVVISEHYTQLLDRLLKEGRLTPIHAVDLKVTYHDPCYLGRHNQIYEEPRAVLQSIPGLELIEMVHSREKSLCCGGGGGGAWSILPKGQHVGVARIYEALSTGAQVVATACPFCIRMLDEAVCALGVENQIAVRDISEVLLQSMSQKDEAEAVYHNDVRMSLEDCHA